MTAPKAPPGLAAAGTAFWRAVTTAYVLRADELLLLDKTCRTLDDTARIEAALAGESLLTPGSTGQPRAHPLLPELRGMRSLLAALVRQIDLPEQAADGSWTTAVSERKRRAANTRWNRERALRGDAASG